MRHALVNKAGEVVNIIVLEDGADWTAPSDLIVVRDILGKAVIGGSYNGDDFASPTSDKSEPSRSDEPPPVA